MGLAMLTRDLALFTPPMNSSMIFGLFPAAMIRGGAEISFARVLLYPSYVLPH
jgi:hypothetical protein